jgi:CubicO group peptidase (beta-lactamase class C family)
MFNDVNTVEAFNAALPASKSKIASYMAGQMMQFGPGTDSIYSNFGFSLLGRIVEKKTNSFSYTVAVKNTVLAPLGVTRANLGRSLWAIRAAGEVRYHGAGLWAAPSVMSSSRPWVPGTYGGFNLENMDSHGGWTMAAPDYAKVLAAFDRGTSNPILHQSTAENVMWQVPVGFAMSVPNLPRKWFKADVGGGITAYGHNGELPGSAALTFRRSDKLSFVVFINKDVWLWIKGQALGNALNAEAAKITTWPTNNLFCSVGIPCSTCIVHPSSDLPVL